jgi:hypothetical protein
LLTAGLACNFLTPTTQTGNSKLLFKDDFSDSGSGWDQVRDGDGITDYENGGYRIFIDTIGSHGNGMSYWANPGLSHQFPADVQIEVDAAKTAGPDDNDFGLMCRYSEANDSQSFYQFMATSDGYAGIILVNGGDQKILSAEKLQPSDAVKKGAATNHLRADCIGNSLTLYVNGQKTATATDATLTSGDVGLIAGTYSEPGTDILFDNYIVTQP